MYSIFDTLKRIWALGKCAIEINNNNNYYYYNFLGAQHASFVPTSRFFVEYSTRLAPAPQDSKRTFGYQVLINADLLLNQNKACFQAFY